MRQNQRRNRETARGPRRETRAEEGRDEALTGETAGTKRANQNAINAPEEDHGFAISQLGPKW